MASRIAIVLAILIHTLIAHIPIARSSGFSLKLIPRDQIDTVLFPKNLTLLQKHEIFVELAKQRALYFKTMALAQANSNNNTITPQTPSPYIVRIFTSLYIAVIRIGSNEYEANLLFDTGSDDTWLQCDGCTNCFPISGGSFKYYESHSYKLLHCDDPLCDPKICDGDVCHYSISYMVGAKTEGVLNSDVISFDKEQAGRESFENLVFGCGLDNQNIKFDGDLTQFNVIAGIMGMGTGKRSILTQLESETNLRFSYCLVSWTTKEPPYSYIHFGNEAHISGDNVKTTPLLPQGLPRYYVSCKGISMNNQLLSIDPAVLALKPDRSGGFAFDTGTGATLLVRPAYEAVKQWVIAFFHQRGVEPVKVAGSPYDPCYNQDAAQIVPMPKMTYHFEGGADLLLDSNQVFQYFDSGIFCLVVAPLDDLAAPNILGAFQHVNYRFLFDVRAMTVSFVSTASCQNT